MTDKPEHGNTIIGGLSPGTSLFSNASSGGSPESPKDSGQSSLMDVLGQSQLAKLPFLGGKADLTAFPEIQIRRGEHMQYGVQPPDDPATAAVAQGQAESAAESPERQMPNPAASRKTAKPSEADQGEDALTPEQLQMFRKAVIGALSDPKKAEGLADTILQTLMQCELLPYARQLFGNLSGQQEPPEPPK